MTNLKGHLYINSKDAWTEWGAVPGKGFLDALFTPPPMKPLIENASRLENGKRVDGLQRFDTREVTLTFNIHSKDKGGATSLAFELVKEFTKNAQVTIYVTLDGSGSLTQRTYEGVFVYKKSTTYKTNTRRTICTLAVKFEQPSPHMDILTTMLPKPPVWDDSEDWELNALSAIAEDGFTSSQTADSEQERQQQKATESNQE